MQDLNVVILAAGQGKRMNSDLPKVLHHIGDIPMLIHVLETAKQLQPNRLIIVYGHGGEQVKAKVNSLLPDNNFLWAEQEKQLGTGHALKTALPYLSLTGATLLLYGDVPLIDFDTLNEMLTKYDDNVVMLSATLDNPAGYGRIIRNEEGQISGIVEEKDASASEKFIREINTGFYLLPNKYLGSWLNNLSNKNSQGEYYVTDIVGFAYKESVDITYVNARHNYTIMGVNNKLQLEFLERMFQHKKADKLLEAGATLLDKSRIDIRGNVTVGKDCIIDVNCIFEGQVSLGNNVKIGAGSILKNITVGNNVEIKPYSIIEDAIVGGGCKIGPFSRIRPGTQLHDDAHVGNFVEIKNSTIGAGSKVNHLTYIGDSTVGAKVNVGAGSVTCNYDGKNKFRTIIEDNVFVGSGTMMVAPVTLGEGSVIGAGSTITKNTPPNELTISRARQSTIIGWLKRTRK
jgi:bifunctional UDP-N-acetylglucosamine pyrophosphorylase/glucosamine-1-phosphate N-acetyltransferase